MIQKPVKGVTVPIENGKAPVMESVTTADGVDAQ